MGRHSNQPIHDGIIVSVAPSSIRHDKNGVLKVQCNIWFGSTLAADLDNFGIDLNDFIRNALLAESEKDRLTLQESRNS